MDILTYQVYRGGYLVNGSYHCLPGTRLYVKVEEMIAAGGVPEPEFTPIEELANARQAKLIELKAEGLSRIKAIMPALSDWDVLELIRELWLSIAPAARQATSTLQSVIDVYQAGRDAAAAINALADTSQVAAYDVVTDPAWPI